jgi:ABC-type glycerol-3-phosphate transport system permease component
VIFLITLIIPFSVSLYSIFLLFEVWQHNSNWTKLRKTLLTVLIIVAVPLVIILIDKILRIVIEQDILKSFINTYKLDLRHLKFIK